MTKASTGQSSTTQHFGLSTDEKPVNPVIGATFFETDTRNEFVYAGAEAGWVRDKVSSVAETVSPLIVQARSVEVVLEELLVQQKIANAHLAAITGDVRDESDIPAEVR